MRTLVKIAFMVIISFNLILSFGCAQKSIYPEFFGEKYPHFKPGPEGGADLLYIKKGVDFSKYSKIMVDQQFYFDSGSKYNAIHPKAIAALEEAMLKAIVDATGNTYPLVDKPRPDVLRIRLAITDLIPLSLATAANHKRSVENQEDILGKYISIGGASMQAEFLDSWTNERVGAVIDIKSVEKFTDVRGIDEWENTKEAFMFWADRLRQFLDKAHGLK